MITTNKPIHTNRRHITNKIAKFWDDVSSPWKMIWGQHIHHGYYENNKSLTPAEAQELLIEKLSALLTISPGNQILDVGCGMGGSSIYLAKKYNVHVTGITLSKKQVILANEAAHKNSLFNLNFKIADALNLSEYPDNSFDIVWSLESCEQFFSKELFLQEAFRVLKPNGKLMLATWCSSHESYEKKLEKQYRKLCKAFDLPYMPTMEYYKKILQENKFMITQSLDWSLFVRKSWEIGLALLNKYNFIHLIKLGGWKSFRFARQVYLMRNAFYQNQVKYGVFIATKPHLPSTITSS